MSLLYEERPSGSPYVETVTRGQIIADDSVIRPAESCWHLVVVRQHDPARATARLPRSPTVVVPPNQSVLRWCHARTRQILVIPQFPR